MGPAGSGKAVQVRTGKVLPVLVRPGWVGHGKAVWVGFGKVVTGSVWWGVVRLSRCVGLRNDE